MKYPDRKITANILNKLQPNKVVIVLGARRVGKTMLVKELLTRIKEQVLV